MHGPDHCATTTHQLPMSSTAGGRKSPAGTLDCIGPWKTEKCLSDPAKLDPRDHAGPALRWRRPLPKSPMIGLVRQGLDVPQSKMVTAFWPKMPPLSGCWLSSKCFTQLADDGAAASSRRHCPRVGPLPRYARATARWRAQSSHVHSRTTVSKLPPVPKHRLRATAVRRDRLGASGRPPLSTAKPSAINPGALIAAAMAI